MNKDYINAKISEALSASLGKLPKKIDYLSEIKSALETIDWGDVPEYGENRNPIELAQEWVDEGKKIERDRIIKIIEGNVAIVSGLREASGELWAKLQIDEDMDDVMIFRGDIIKKIKEE